MEIRSPKGTRDVLPQESYAWQWIEGIIREETALAAYREVRTPVFEHTELFLRGVGETTDIVQKEMYTFLDKGGRSITLKPEGTAGAVRALVEHKLYAEPLPQKMYYVNNPIFRYENPQHGRLREHHQFGMECFGTMEPSADAEVILTLLKILNRLGLKNPKVHINSIGCPACRPAYHAALKAYFQDYLGGMCGQCRERFERNPLRILDCKEEGCRVIAKDAPLVLDYLCAECQAHFDGLKSLLSGQKVDYDVDPRIVRGLDYYTKTVFEVLMDSPRGPIALCGGGRYDGLVEEIGGPGLPGVGFGIGTERILLELANRGITPPMPRVADAFVASPGADSRPGAFDLCIQLRNDGIKAECDHLARSLKAQFRYADKLGAAFMVILGADEMARGAAKVKAMDGGREEEVPLSDISKFIRERLA